MTVRGILLIALAALFIGGCGAGDQAVVQTGLLHVSSGGSGSIIYTRTQESLDFSNSVSVAVRTSYESATQFTVYTFFGLSHLDFTAVPTAVLVTFVDGLDPSASSSTSLPSSVVGMMLHTGFDRNHVVGNRVLAQDAPVTYESTTSGTLVLEPQSSGSGFVNQDSANRRARWAVLTLTDLSNGDQVLIDGAVNYALSQNLNQDFFSYAGDLGLDTQPPFSGGGPPPPPGSTGGTSSGGSGGGSGGGTDSPPAPPI